MQKYLNRVDLAKSFPWEYLLPNIGFDTAENERLKVDVNQHTNEVGCESIHFSIHSLGADRA